MITKRQLYKRLKEIEQEQGSCRGMIAIFRKRIKDVPMTRHDAQYMLDDIRSQMEIYFYPVKGQTRQRYEDNVKAGRKKALFSVKSIAELTSDKIEWK